MIGWSYNNGYQGCYDEKQVENHSVLEPEYADLQAMLLHMQSFMNLNKERKADFSKVEERLNICLPEE